MTEFRDLVGKTLVRIEQDYDELRFYCSDGSEYRMYHYQDCCESVSIEDIDGDIQRLVGQEILVAEERTKDDDNNSYGLGMWTFYTLRTNLDSVTIRWYGESNGYYSVSVDFECVSDPDPVEPDDSQFVPVFDYTQKISRILIYVPTVADNSVEIVTFRNGLMHKIVVAPIHNLLRMTLNLANRDEYVMSVHPVESGEYSMCLMYTRR